MIPALAFNEARSEITDQINKLGDHYAAIVPRLLECSKISNGVKFQSKVSSIFMNKLIISASSHSGTYINREDPNGYDLVIPVEGSFASERGGSRHVVNAGETCLLATFENARNEISGSNVIIRLDQQRLKATCASMIADNCQLPDSEGSRTLQLQYKNTSLFNLFRSLLSQIDCVDCNPKHLEKLAFDDRIYRLSAVLIYPKLLLSDELASGRRPHFSPKINRLCQYIRANLTQPISLTEMETMTGLSTRKLQYAFTKQVGMGPKEWAIKQRLHGARSALLDSFESFTLDPIAYQFCFLSLSDFSRHYQKEFGERPEQTVRRRRS